MKTRISDKRYFTTLRDFLIDNAHVRKSILPWIEKLNDLFYFNENRQGVILRLYNIQLSCLALSWHAFVLPDNQQYTTYSTRTDTLNLLYSLNQ